MAEDGGESRREGEGAPQPCGIPLTERSESNPRRLFTKRFGVLCPRSECGGKSRAEGALSAAPGCPAWVCVVAGNLLASSVLIFVDFLGLSGSPGRALGDRRALTPRGTRPREAHHEPPTPHLCPRLRRLL